MPPKKILILCYSELHRDPRIYRQIIFLKDRYEIITAGLTSPEIDGVKFIKIDYPRPWYLILFSVVRLLLKNYEKFYWSGYHIKNTLKKLSVVKFDLILANDLNTLPVAIALAEINGGKVFLDAHEYEPRHYDHKLSFKLLFQGYWGYICRKYLPKVDDMVTVSERMAEEYKKNYGVDCKVINNSPFYYNLSPSQVGDKIRLVHHGALNRARRIEYIIKLMDYLDDRFLLDFILLPNDPAYLRRLKSMAKNNSRIKFLDPVKMLDIPVIINHYDIGLNLYYPSSFHLKITIPNKIFEFIQARLAVLTWPYEGINKLVQKHKVGIIAESFTIKAAADCLNKLENHDIELYKHNSDKAAKELCAENSKQLFEGIVKSLIG